MKTNRYFLGVDIGGTKSHALIADQNGRAIGFGESGPGNHEVVGYDGLVNVLQEVTCQALNIAAVNIEDISGAGLGIAGYDWPSERQTTLEAVAHLNLEAPIEIVNDTIIGLVAGAEQGWGVALVAGTGHNCWGWDRDHRIGRVTGSGELFGEFGGAYTIVIKAVQAISAQWSKRGPDTELAETFINETGARDISDLLEGLCQKYYHLDAGAARAVFQTAEQGDEVAINIIHWAGVELAELACGVIRQLSFEEIAFDLVLVGSLFDGGPLLIDPLQETILDLAPHTNFVRLRTPPVVGGALLGMSAAGIDYTNIRQVLIETAKILIP